MARRWRKRIVKSRDDAAAVDGYLEVRYEDLVEDTESVLRRVCELIELDYDPAMLTYHERAEERLQEMAGRSRRARGAPSARRASGSTHTRAPPSPRLRAGRGLKGR